MLAATIAFGRMFQGHCLHNLNVLVLDGRGCLIGSMISYSKLLECTIICSAQIESPLVGCGLAIGMMVELYDLQLLFPHVSTDWMFLDSMVDVVIIDCLLLA